MQPISTKKWKQHTAVLVLILAFAVGLTQSAQAFPSIRNSWKAQYPGSTTDDNVLAGTGSECQICHQSSGGGNGWNAYGWRIRQGIEDGSLSATDAIIAAQPFDSDFDPVAASNLTEIDGGTQPGWTPGGNNTIFFKNGTTLAGQSPPSISGDLDPPAPPVPVSGPWARFALIAGMSLLGLVTLRIRAGAHRA